MTDQISFVGERLIAFVAFRGHLMAPFEMVTQFSVSFELDLTNEAMVSGKS